MMTGVPVMILKEGTTRERGKNAQKDNINAARAIADAVRTTLGPRGMDKLLVDSLGDVTITNDGVTILKEIDVQHPGAKMLVEVAKTQDQQCGDGTTTAVIIAGELLKKAESLIEQNVHPTVISNGYRMACDEAMKLIEDIAIKIEPNDEKQLKNIAMTAMNSKNISASREKLGDICVRAVRAIMEKRGDRIVADTDYIKVEKKHGGSIDDTEIIDGVIIDKERVHPRMKKEVKNAKIALLNCALEIKKTEVESKITIRDPTQLQKFLDEEEATFKRMVEKIKKSGANVVFTQKGIDDVVAHYLAKEGIFALKQLKESDLVKLSRATMGKIITTLDDLKSEDLGTAEKVEEKKIGDSNMTFVTGTKHGKSVSILVRGGSRGRTVS